MVDKKTGAVTHMLKLRGITLDYNAAQQLQFDTFKDMVLSILDGTRTLSVKRQRICRSNKLEIFTKEMTKQYRPIYEKGFIGPNFVIYPYGYQFN